MKSFVFEKAEKKDLPDIMALMGGAGSNTASDDWFAADTEETVEEHLDRKGFVLLARSQGKTAAFLIVRFPGEEKDNLGRHIGLAGEGLLSVAHLESAVVESEFRGNQLQYRLMHAAEELLAGGKIRYLMATVHPDNRFSRANLEKLGCTAVEETAKYGGLRRLVMAKKIS